VRNVKYGKINEFLASVERRYSHFNFILYLFFYNQTATENITKFPPKKYFEHRLSDKLRKSKILNNALLHTTIFQKFCFPFFFAITSYNSSLFNEFACNLGFFGMSRPV
jgi:hypothetical protein